jgi:AcrR family transcriptional regulator
MPQQADNLRVRRTRTLLRTALVELIEERGFDRLTVGEITERAMVSRAAFYRNYRDKYQLVEQIFDEAVEALIGSLSTEDTSSTERLVSFYEHIAEYHRLYGALLGGSGSPWFANRMRAMFADLVKPHFPNPPEHTEGLVPSLQSAMFVQTIVWWLDNGRPITPGELAAQYTTIAGAVIAAANA